MAEVRESGAWRRYAARLGLIAVSLAAFGVDRTSKAAVVAFFSERGEWARAPLLGDALSLVYERNSGMSFGIGADFDGFLGIMLLVAVPAVLALAALAWALCVRRMRPLRRWALAAYAGAGIGNVIDRAFDPDGVLDFIKLGINGAFGIDYLPAFNAADLIILASGALVVISFFIRDAKEYC